MTITPDWLEAFQLPPAPHETDMGTVAPFTAPELAAIDRYQQATAVIPDCLDGIFISGPEVFTEHEAEFRPRRHGQLRNHAPRLAPRLVSGTRLPAVRPVLL